MRKLLIAFGVLVLLLIAADRVAVVVAENQISGKIATAYGLPAKPAVTVRGFPFLTQVLTGSYAEIDVTASEVDAGGTTLHDLHARFIGVHAPLSEVLGHGAATVTAARATGSALVTYQQVDRRLPAGLRLRASGQHALVSGKVSFQGLRLPVSAIVSLAAAAGGIKVTPVHVTVAGNSSPVASAYAARLGIVIPVSAMPLHLHLTSVRVAPGGLRVGAAASDVHFARA